MKGAGEAKYVYTLGGQYCSLHFAKLQHSHLHKGVNIFYLVLKPAILVFEHNETTQNHVALFSHTFSVLSVYFGF